MSVHLQELRRTAYAMGANLVVLVAEENRRYTHLSRNGYGYGGLWTQHKEERGSASRFQRGCPRVLHQEVHPSTIPQVVRRTSRRRTSCT